MSGNEAGAVFTFGLAMGVLLSALLTSAILSSSYESDLINRGYALYCPTNGEFAFKGECNK